MKYFSLLLIFIFSIQIAFADLGGHPAQKDEEAMIYEMMEREKAKEQAKSQENESETAAEQSKDSTDQLSKDNDAVEDQELTGQYIFSKNRQINNLKIAQTSVLLSSLTGSVISTYMIASGLVLLAPSTQLGTPVPNDVYGQIAVGSTLAALSITGAIIGGVITAKIHKANKDLEKLNVSIDIRPDNNLFHSNSSIKHFNSLYIGIPIQIKI
jgi:hypothetical protein